MVPGAPPPSPLLVDADVSEDAVDGEEGENVASPVEAPAQGVQRDPRGECVVLEKSICACTLL